MLCRDTGRLPWELGYNVSPAHFRQAALLLSQAFQGRAIVQRCPLLGE